ncbi:MAG: type I secretion C-terminal target domain-containing protein [Candidatus Binatia bacterium]
MSTDGTNPGAADQGEAGTQGEALKVQEVLSGVQSEGAGADVLLAHLSFDTVGGDTVVRVDLDGVGPSAPVAIATLEGITGVTLQQLLNNGTLDIGC